MPVLIQFRRDTNSEWKLRNPVLEQGELALDTTRQSFTVGDGFSTWETAQPYDAVYTFNDLFLI